MINSNVGELTNNMELEPGASQEAISRAESELARLLPDDYKAFVSTHNGGEGWIGTDGYLRLWPIEKIASENARHNVGTIAPGLVLFGGDGGGSGYAFDYRKYPHIHYVIIPIIGLSLDHAYRCGDTFLEFLNRVGSGTELPD